MNAEKWNALRSWFYKTGHKSSAIPSEVRDALEALIDERESADDDDDEDDYDEEK